MGWKIERGGRCRILVHPRNWGGHAVKSEKKIVCSGGKIRKRGTGEFKIVVIRPAHKVQTVGREDRSNPLEITARSEKE